MAMLDNVSHLDLILMTVFLHIGGLNHKLKQKSYLADKIIIEYCI